jgi:hypothetical protein
MRSLLLLLSVLCLAGSVSLPAVASDSGEGDETEVAESAESGEQDDADRGDEGATGRFRPVTGEKNARLAIISSAVFPGLGQLYNDEGLRTIVLFAWEGYYIARILRDGYEADLHRRKARTMSDGDLWRGLDRDGVRRRFVYFEERETDYIWYAAALLLASILDAYVFAQLHDFDTDGIRGVGRAGILPVIKPQVSAVGLQFRMQF